MTLIAFGKSINPERTSPGGSPRVAWLVSCPRNSRYIVAIKMGRRQGGPSRTGVKGAYLNRYVTDEQRGRRPIFNATLRRHHHYLRDGTLVIGMYVVMVLEEAHEDLRNIVAYKAAEIPVQRKRSVASCSIER